MSYAIREYREGDEQQILALLRLVLMDSWQFDSRYWDWMYRNNPTKVMRIWVAESGGKIIGHFAFMPVKMRVLGENTLGTLAINIAIHPDYQGKGIFNEFIRRSTESNGRDSIPITYVFPNQRSLPIFSHKFHWSTVCSLRPLFRPVDPIRTVLCRIQRKDFKGAILSTGVLLLSKTLFRPKKTPVDKGIHIEKLRQLDEKIDSFFKKAAAIYPIITVRDREYLTWRYIQRPTNGNYSIFTASEHDEIVGYIILKTDAKEDPAMVQGALMDLMVLPGREEIIGALISRVVADLKELRAETLSCHLPESNTYYPHLRLHGFIPDFCADEKKQPRLVGTFNTQGAAQEAALDPKSWFITNGDRNDI